MNDSSERGRTAILGFIAKLSIERGTVLPRSWGSLEGALLSYGINSGKVSEKEVIAALAEKIDGDVSPRELLAELIAWPEDEADRAAPFECCGCWQHYD